MDFPLVTSLNKVGLPLIVTSSKPSLCFLVDTGSTHNVLFSYVYESLPDFFTKEDAKADIIGIGGNHQSTLSAKGFISFGETMTNPIFSIVDASETISAIQQECGVQIHGILGIPFLIQNEWILDFKKLTISK